MLGGCSAVNRGSAFGREGGGGSRRGREGVGGRGFCGPNASNPVILRETALLKASEAGDMRIARRRGGGGKRGGEGGGRKRREGVGGIGFCGPNVQTKWVWENLRG